MTARFPPSLRSSATPRWSHRDPVEGGNPFTPDDPRHAAWQAATREAMDELIRLDRQLGEETKRGSSAEPYPIRVVALAVARFDIWARRCCVIVQDKSTLEDYRRWLDAYTRSWIVYVADTCPNVEVGGQLLANLNSRAKHWVAEARGTLAKARSGT